uniref:Filamin binding LIM protein 1 n=1 Tax=Xiphophorus couchianus TaxID=32473 RepID=A0A3B5L4Q9_9TELE
MASAAPQKRMVSSVFITLSSPHRATVTQQQQPALHSHSGPDRQHSAAGDDLSSLRQRAAETSPTSTDRNWTGVGPRAKLFPPPPPDVLPSSFSKDAAPPPPPPPPPSLISPLRPQSPDQLPVSNKEFNMNHRLILTFNICNCADLCGFCRKPMTLSEPAIEALNRIYHEGCFQCRSCHVPLAGKQYYNKAGIPLCEGCYQASLELCWTCGEIITDQIIRAIERTYHPSCFTCTTCNQQIGAQAFAQGDVGEVYCLQDYYRKYAPMCSACDQLIIPKEDGTDSYTVECLGRSYHENCYRCEDCGIQLSPEPNERGCYPLEGKMLCKACHVSLVSGQQ